MKKKIPAILALILATLSTSVIAEQTTPAAKKYKWHHPWFNKDIVSDSPPSWPYKIIQEKDGVILVEVTPPGSEKESAPPVPAPAPAQEPAPKPDTATKSISLTPSQLGVKANIMRIISRYEDVGEIAMECKDQYRAYQPRNEMVRQCIRESRKSLEDLKKSIALIDNLLSKGEWAYEGESISSNDMMDKVLTICAKDTISDVYHNFSAMETCLKMAYQRLYSQLNYQ